MSGRQSSATERALRMIAKGASQSAAARKHGLAISTVWRACKAQREWDCIVSGYREVHESFTKRENLRLARLQDLVRDMPAPCPALPILPDCVPEPVQTISPK